MIATKKTFRQEADWKKNLIQSLAEIRVLCSALRFCSAETCLTDRHGAGQPDPMQ
ncbi:hypothetical protein [Martelella alba]|uniref:hypothetical protein n=1 Tax=Martelella alba TaxID=2590451 RepID=UPI0015E860AB|nr:hypothetical protein [Martelella alba]